MKRNTQRRYLQHPLWSVSGEGIREEGLRAATHLVLDQAHFYKNSGSGWEQHTSSGWQSASKPPESVQNEAQARSEGEERYNSFRQASGSSGWGSKSGGGGWGGGGRRR